MMAEPAPSSPWPVTPTGARITGGDVFRPLGRSRRGRELVTIDVPLVWGVEGPDGPTFVTVPAGFVTDFASIPRPVWPLFPPFGPWALAAILHDWLYVTRGEGGRWSRADADRMFREAMEEIAKAREDGQPAAWKRAIIYRAVRVGGAGGWGS